MSENDKTSTNPTSPLKAIRAKCLDCSCWQVKEVRLCPVTKCALYPFRFGKNPYRKKKDYSEKEKKAMVARLKGSQKSKNLL